MFVWIVFTFICRHIVIDVCVVYTDIYCKIFVWIAWLELITRLTCLILYLYEIASLMVYCLFEIEKLELQNALENDIHFIDRYICRNIRRKSPTLDYDIIDECIRR